MTTTDPERVAEIAATLSADEKSRLLYGRPDWRDHDWQDHCGDPNCDHCTGLIPDPNPRALRPIDAAVRAHLTERNPDAA